MARKKKQHEHHGGAWKVAYADFVTAMMALFMVLWISAQEDEILIATAQYFQHPFDSPLDMTSGVLGGMGQQSTGGGQLDEAPPTNIVSMEFLQSLAKEFYRMLQIDEADSDRPIDIRVTNDGLRIIVYDRAKRPLFEGDTDQFTEWGALVTRNLAWILDRHEMRARIDSHTDSDTGELDKWELSVDRAQAMRKRLVRFALDPAKVERVTGFADSRPLPGVPRDDPSNQRIELSLVFN